MRTQVGIVGGGPARLLLSHLLHLGGIESVVLEVRGREALETTVRAGVLEHGTVELLKEIGAGERMAREGAVHHGVNLQFGGERRRIDFADLTGKSITVYGARRREIVGGRGADRARDGHEEAAGAGPRVRVPEVGRLRAPCAGALAGGSRGPDVARTRSPAGPVPGECAVSAVFPA